MSLMDDFSVQRALRQKGLYTGKIDGDFGPGSKAALAKVEFEPPVADRRIGFEQVILAETGFYKGAIDGKVGPKSNMAVKRWMLTLRLSPHFTLAQFVRSDAAKKLGDDNMPSGEHLENLYHTAQGLEEVHQILGAGTISITSGYRNPRVNKSVGGVPNSDHALGFAVDIRHPDYTSLALALKLETALRNGRIRVDQLIHETSRRIVHLSFNPRYRGQVLTQKKGPGTPVTAGL